MAIAEQQCIIPARQSSIDVHIERDQWPTRGTLIHLGLQCIGWKRDDQTYAGVNLTPDEARRVARAILDAIEAK